MNASGQLPSRTFYPRGKTFRYALNRTLVEPGAGLGVLFLPGIEPRFFGRPDRSLVTILTELLASPLFLLRIQKLYGYNMQVECLEIDYPG